MSRSSPAGTLDYVTDVKVPGRLHGRMIRPPASIHHARAALDQDAAVIGYAFESKGFSRIDIDTNESDPCASFAGQLIPAK
jgi:hypothetical protein